MNPMFVYAVAIASAAAILYGALRVFSAREREEEDGLESAPAPELRVLSRTRMGRGRTLVVIEVEGRRLLLGSTHAQWCALADLGATRTPGDENPFGPFDAELARALQATRYRRGWKHS